MWRWDPPLWGPGHPDFERDVMWGRAKGAINVLERGQIPFFADTGSTERPETYYETVEALGFDPLEVSG
jgi:hypothetical protein